MHTEWPFLLPIFPTPCNILEQVIDIHLLCVTVFLKRLHKFYIKMRKKRQKITFTHHTKHKCLRLKLLLNLFRLFA